jgi:hypothetical protein
MNLTAIFETWYIGDRSYPALQTGMLVNLSFEMLMDEFAEIEAGSPERFEHLGGAEYDCIATTLRNYAQGTQRVVVAEAAGFRFYTVSTKTAALTSGRQFHARGRLVLDHYIWSSIYRVTRTLRIFSTGCESIRYSVLTSRSASSSVALARSARPQVYAPVIILSPTSR